MLLTIFLILGCVYFGIGILQVLYALLIHFMDS
jgi:hypothetical protein